MTIPMSSVQCVKHDVDFAGFASRIRRMRSFTFLVIRRRLESIGRQMLHHHLSDAKTPPVPTMRRPKTATLFYASCPMSYDYGVIKSILRTYNLELGTNRFIVFGYML